ncbi:MAG: hypothetical protein H0V44_14455 [Planctomycetes bacterium]|nr:hypothetical protein [Planctomycetota bacterium]
MTALLCAHASGEGEPVPTTIPDPAAWNRFLHDGWEFAAGGSTDFNPIRVPGDWSMAQQYPDYQVGATWVDGTYRCSFELPAGTTGACLSFEAIRWGGGIAVNGKSVGLHDLGFAPITVDISHALRVGTNIVEVTPRGWPAVERFDTGDTKIPCGAANWFGHKPGGITGEVILQVYEGARIADIQIRPKIHPRSCTVNVEVQGGRQPWKGALKAAILSDDGKAMSAVVTHSLVLSAGATTPVSLPDIALADAALWWPEAPAMHRARVWLESDGQGAPASVREESFGLREVATKDGNFYLNDRRQALHGLTGVWTYGDFTFMSDAKRLKAYQVTLFKAMNAAAFRSHQEPLVRSWLDLCDRNGILVFLEFPNFPDVQRLPMWSLKSPYERPEFWEALKREITGMMRQRMNHPSIVGWSVSNEGNGFGDWERDHLVPYVQAIDATRPIMLSADTTQDLADSHNFMGNWFGTQRDFERAMADLASAYPDRLTGCSEFAQGEPGALRHGVEKAQRDSSAVDRDLAYIAMEQVEALRRLRFDLIMAMTYPLGAAKESGNLADVPEQFHAMRNALSPLAVSIDRSHRHGVAGTTITVPVWAMSDAESAQGQVSVDVMLLDRHPGFGWNGDTAGFGVLAKVRIAMSIAPWQARSDTAIIQIPEAAGAYTLAAVMRDASGAMRALSLRPLRVYAPLPPVERPRTVGVIETDGRIAAWLTRRGHRVVYPYGDVIPEVIVAGEGMLQDPRCRSWGFVMSERVKAGAKLVILEQQAWNPDAFAGIVLRSLTSATMRQHEEPLHPLAALPTSVGSSADFLRLNGVDGIGLRVRIEPKATAAPAVVVPDNATTGVAAATKSGDEWDWAPWLVGYSRGFKNPDWAVARRSCGQGEIIACQVPLVARIDATAADMFDSVAERLLAHLIEADPSP